MNDEINKIIQSISDFYKLDNALKYYLDRHKAQILLDYITNLQQKENQYDNNVKMLNDIIKEQDGKLTNLQHTKEYLGEVLYEKDEELEKLKEKIKHYQETVTFSDYVKEVNLLVDYKSRCEKAVEYIKEAHEQDFMWLSIFEKELLNILNGSDE